MVAQADRLRFYVDESAMGLGKALAAARSDTVHCGHPLVPECPTGTPDEVWIPAVAARDLTCLGRDKHIRTRPAERRLLRQAGLRVFRVGGKKDLSTWDWLGRLHRYWPRIEEILRDRPDGPYFYLVDSNGLQEVPLVDELPRRRRVTRQGWEPSGGGDGLLPFPAPE